VPLTLGGYAVTLTASSGALAKRLIKGNPRLWHVAQQARKLLRGSGF
jgi:CelD/BcsL family acetyltransferase involved in cellulose biosynthesis